MTGLFQSNTLLNASNRFEEMTTTCRWRNCLHGTIRFLCATTSH